jgi:dienelactone hydrolase
MSIDRGSRGTVAVTVWYPTTSASTGSAPVADGVWPIIVFSHGLRGLPQDYEGLLTTWAKAGYIVAAPTYPNTGRESAHVNPGDVSNQPADAIATIDAVVAAAKTPGDLFNGKLDATHIMAAGHSEGAITTIGLFDECCRDPRLVAGVILAGNSLGFPGHPAGPSAPILFIHGDKDRLVPIALGKAAYREFQWPRAFLTLNDQAHIDPYLKPDTPAFQIVTTTTIAFFNYASGRTDLTPVRATFGAKGTDVIDELG